MIATPDVAIARSGLVAEVACLPLGDGLLVAFDLEDTLITWTPLQASFGAFTRLSASLPTKAVRRAEDVAFLQPGDRLALVGASERPGFARLILLFPEVLSGHVLLEARDPPLVPPKLPDFDG